MIKAVEAGSVEDRAVGALVGLAVGDALGTSVEFQRRGSFAPVTGMRGGGVFKMPPGGWTDDTSMALALGEALLEDRTLQDPATVMNRWVNWWRDGKFSHTGECFDIGNQTVNALSAWHASGQLPTQDGWSAGNGGIMRLAPAVLAHLDDLSTACAIAARQSDFTHRNPLCRQYALDLAAILIRLIDGISVSVPTEIATRRESDVKSTGYVVDTFEAALWAFASEDCFAATVLRAVNLGDDADTVGAVAGQLAGARYGLSGIPTEWLEVLLWRDEIIAMGRALCRLSYPAD
ncbi:MAG: hypothetical protein B7Z80_14455 [Rhodospirillales bacterium 20-64-7]|nr:MAG: hypothetical protein B7Z80_14455 [Rhodospirillales bacterium 20-64-7]